MFNFYAGPVRILPNVGTLLGGFPVRVSGPCFKSRRVLCRFNKTIVSGVVVTPNVAICVPPMFTRVGVVPLSVSVDGGDTYTSAVGLKLGMTSTIICIEHICIYISFHSPILQQSTHIQIIHVIMDWCIDAGEKWSVPCCCVFLSCSSSRDT